MTEPYYRPVGLPDGSVVRIADDSTVDDWLARAEGGDWLHHELAEIIKGLQGENARLRTQVNDWLDVLVWAADSWPEGQPRLDDAINRYEPWP